MNSVVLHNLIDSKIINIKEDKTVYLQLAINAALVYYQELTKVLTNLDCQEVLTNDLFSVSQAEPALYYQYNSLLNDQLFSFFGDFKSNEKTRLNLFIVMELIIEVTKSVFNVPLFSGERLSNKNEFVLYTFIRDKHIEVASFKIDRVDKNYYFTGFINKEAVLTLLTSHVNSQNDLVLSLPISPYQVLIEPIKPERMGIMDYTRHLYLLLEKEGISVKLLDPTYGKETSGIPFIIRVSKKEVRDKSVTLIDNFNSTIIHIDESELIRNLQIVRQNQISSMYNQSLKKYLGEFATSMNPEKTYLLSNWCGEEVCLKPYESDYVYLPFNQNINNKQCSICHKEARKSIILVKKR